MHSTLSVYSLDGLIQGEKVRTIVAEDGFTLNYLERLLYPDGCTKRKLGHIPALKAYTLRDNEADIVAIGANMLLQQAYADHGFFVVPRWLCLYLPVKADPDERIAGFDRATRKYFRRLVRKIQDGGYSCEVTTDPEWFDMFYSDMYKPYAINRHGNNAIIHHKAKVRNAFLKGAGVVVKKHNTQVGGVIIYRNGPILHMPHIGILNGDINTARDGATTTLDYCVVHLAHYLGCSHMNFGHTRPFLSDGVLQYKLNWHMEVRHDDDGIGAIAIATPGLTNAAQMVFKTHPFFYLSDNVVRLHDIEASEETIEIAPDSNKPSIIEESWGTVTG